MDGITKLIKTAEYCGEYPLGAHYFACHCIAFSFEDAQKKMDKWNIGAIVKGTHERSKIPEIGQAGFCHWLFFVAWLSMNAGLADSSYLADDGLFHELIHMNDDIETVQDKNYKKLYKKLLKDLNLI